MKKNGGTNPCISTSLFFNGLSFTEGSFFYSTPLPKYPCFLHRNPLKCHAEPKYIHLRFTITTPNRPVYVQDLSSLCFPQHNLFSHKGFNKFSTISQSFVEKWVKSFYPNNLRPKNADISKVVFHSITYSTTRALVSFPQKMHYYYYISTYSTVQTVQTYIHSMSNMLEQCANTV